MTTNITEVAISNKNFLEVAVSSALANATQVIEEYNSPNSKRAYESDLTYWSAWYQANGLSRNDAVRKEHLIMFIMQHANYMPDDVYHILYTRKILLKRVHSISTIERRIASLSRYLHLNKLTNPCYDKDILVLLRKLTEKNGCSQSWGKAITLDVLNNLLKTCEKYSVADIRDKALLLFGFSTGGRRRSEISEAMLENLTKNSDGTYLYNLNKTKTNKVGRTDHKPIAGRAAMALTHWIEVSQIKDGPIFRGVQKGGNKISSTCLCSKQISRIIKSRCQKAGYDPIQYTAHSLRSGFVTEGGKRLKPIGDIMALTGHKSITQVMKYYQTGDVLNNSAAYLAG